MLSPSAPTQTDTDISTPQAEPNWQPLSDFAKHKQRDSGLKAWLSVVEGCIRALERTAWQGREIADQTLNACRAVGRGAGAMSEEMQQVAAEARRWPARLKRLTQTGWMLTKVMTSYRFWGTKSAFLSSKAREAGLEKLHQKNARRFCELSLEQGGAFLKIGQLLSSRPDLLPQAWIDELAILQDAATPAPPESVRAIVETELGRPLEELFAHFDPAPLAAASIGQVHRAQLHDGRDVAVKVQRPDLDELVELDMALLKVFIDCVKSALPPMDFDTIVGEIQRSVREELDYRREARAMQSVGMALANKPGITVPALVEEYSSRRVLTTGFIRGRKLTHVLDELQQSNRAQLNTLLYRLLDAWCQQVLVGSEFHADPHPGNLLVTDDHTLVLLDFGCTQQLADRHRRQYFRVLQACVVDEQEVIADTLKELGFRTRSGDATTLMAFVSAILDRVREAIINGHHNELEWPSAEEMMAEVAELLTQLEADPVEKMPGNFIMLARVFGTLGGLFMHYQPKVDVAGLMLQYLTQPLDPALPDAA